MAAAAAAEEEEEEEEEEVTAAMEGAGLAGVAVVDTWAAAE